MAQGPFARTLDRLDRLQHAFWFKVIASSLIVLAALAVSTTYSVRLAAKRQVQDTEAASRAADLRSTIEAEQAAEPKPGTAEEKQAAELRAHALAAELTYAQANERAIAKLLASETDPTVVIVAAAAISAMLLTVVWLGQGLSGLAILLIVGLVAVPLMRSLNPTMRDIGRFVAGFGCLAFSFVVLMELLRVLLGGSNAVLAIARNLVNEAVRIKVSLVFIVLLLIALAALPGLLEPSTPLRYRVQSFLQYGSGGTFWIIAILVLFLSVSSLSSEQRDRIIWQTMTKPVAPWQYVLGKWLGVVGVAAVLLAVSSTGVFLFTEYLRDQKADGESAPYVPSDRSGAMSQDRFVLESQILTARKSVRPLLPDIDPHAVARVVAERAEKLRQADPAYDFTAAEERKLFVDYEKEVRASFFAIEGGQQETFEFPGLLEARNADRPITLRYKVDVGANDPKALHKVTFMMPNLPAPIVKEVPLGQMMQLTISPASIDEKGVLPMLVLNGDFYNYRPGGDTMSFPPDGLEINYSVGSYQANFLRVVLVSWLKLALLAMVAILASTFLSFPVACLVAFGVFLMAESAGFLHEALEYYASTGQKGEIIWHRVAIRAVAVPVSRIFQFYSSLKPASALVDGRIIAWDRVLLAFSVIGGVTAILFISAVAIFRRRELATYSGQ
ncbi:MAG: hypothetical protein IT438_11350 [Phycisphaerales bacterium]|nr:hypothetical protein [Phycisphaerales bacterium]